MKNVLAETVFSFLVVCIFFNVSPVFSQDDSVIERALNNLDSDWRNKIVEGLFGTSISGQWFLTWHGGDTDDGPFNEFGLKRGYIDIKKTFSEHLSGRITPDISVDKEGDGRGDIEMRLKYCYIKYTFDHIGMFVKPSVEFGLVHRPWIDFEQSINQYRVQGQMFLEREDIVNSADYGIQFMTLFGGELDKNYQKLVNKKNPGKYGSFAMGIYNGGGYHAVEENENKTFEWRLTLRPLPRHLTGLQFSWHGGIGKGNTVDAHDWEMQSGFVSYENRHLVLTGSYYTGTGNYEGTHVNSIKNVEDGSADIIEAIDQKGRSAFAEVKIPKSKWSLMGRYDTLDQEWFIGTQSTERYIAGIAYRFLPGCKLLLDYDHTSSDIPTWNGYELSETKIFELATEVVF